MKKQVVNPYLPSWEYVPDGEPHLFGDRVYVYGSHDRFGAPMFCVNDYVAWSAPADDLSSWRYEGVIYRRRQDPANRLGLRSLYAPDVCRGSDGRYYLYYAFDFLGRIGVAVCDTPAGKYEYYGTVHFADGHIWGTRTGEPFPFDPRVLAEDDGSVLLYSGFATRVPAIASRGHQLENRAGVLVRLRSDMVTIEEGPKELFPVKGQKGAFPDHAFFEASSIRKVGNRYCFVYSSEHNHELCHAMADTPEGPWTFCGTLVDLGDLYLDGNADERHAANDLGNTHGGLLFCNGHWYIFYHRQTNRTSYARQACAEELKMRPDGGFYQAEVTSCGLNGGPLAGSGRYEAGITCRLTSPSGTGRVDVPFSRLVLRDHPYVTQDGKDGVYLDDPEDAPVQYIANMRSGAVAGFKYFRTGVSDSISAEYRFRKAGEGVLEVSTSTLFSSVCARIPVSGRREKTWRNSPVCPLSCPEGKQALYFRYTGSGAMDFLSFTLS